MPLKQVILSQEELSLDTIEQSYLIIQEKEKFKHQRLSRQIVEKIRMKCYNFRKILDLPNISDLPLSTEEKY